MSRGDFVRAQKILNEIKQSFPSNGWYHQGLLVGSRAFKQGIFRKSIQQRIVCFKQSLAYNPRYESAWRALGMCYMELKQYRKAEDAFQKSLVYARNDIFRGDALRHLSDVALKNGNTKKAFGLLQKVLRMKKRPPYIELANHFIRYYQKIKDKEKVKEWARKGILSARIVEKSGKMAYNDKSAYRTMIKEFETFL